MQEFPLTKFKAESMLDQGIRQYDDGDYKIAARTIQGALDEGLTTRSQARAHKYLAFIDCVSGQQTQCRDAVSQGPRDRPEHASCAPEEAAIRSGARCSRA